MFARRVTTVAFQISGCMPKTLSNSATTFSNSYRRWYKERIKQMKGLSSTINSAYKKKWTHHFRNIFSRSIVANCATTENTNTISENRNGANEENAPKSEQAVISDRLKSLEEEVHDLKDKYQRALADRENTRYRLQREIRDAKVYGIQSFCKDLLEVSDVFRKALASVPKESIENADKEIRNLHDGIVMTEGQMHIVFGRHGLQQIQPKVGQKFDPSCHEAMIKIPADDGQQSGTIANVFRTGWNLGERCIRSAQVSVFK